MPRRFIIANSFLWATAIIISALFKAPVILTIIFLPTLATVSLLMGLEKHPASCCR